jgi:hypothetical protein
VRNRKRKRPKNLDREIKELLSRPTADLRRVAWAFYGLSDQGAYNAARDGSIACVKVSGRWRALTAPLKKMVEQPAERTHQDGECGRAAQTNATAAA